MPVAEILARAAPSPPTLSKPKSSNFLQVPDLEGPRYISIVSSYLFNPLILANEIEIKAHKIFHFRPKSVPNSPSFSSRGISRFSHLRNQISSAWSNASTKSTASAKTKKATPNTLSVSSVSAQGQLHPEDKKKWPSAQDCRGILKKYCNWFTFSAFYTQ